MPLEVSLGQCLKSGANSVVSLAPSRCPCVGLNLLASPSSLYAQAQGPCSFLLLINHLTRNQGSKQATKTQSAIVDEPRVCVQG